jgi:hypothetical protein
MITIHAKGDTFCLMDGVQIWNAEGQKMLFQFILATEIATQDGLLAHSY